VTKRASLKDKEITTLPPRRSQGIEAIFGTPPPAETGTTTVDELGLPVAGEALPLLEGMPAGEADLPEKPPSPVIVTASGTIKRQPPTATLPVPSSVEPIPDEDENDAFGPLESPAPVILVASSGGAAVAPSVSAPRLGPTQPPAHDDINDLSDSALHGETAPPGNELFGLSGENAMFSGDRDLFDMTGDSTVRPEGNGNANRPNTFSPPTPSTTIPETPSAITASVSTLLGGPGISSIGGVLGTVGPADPNALLPEDIQAGRASHTIQPTLPQEVDPDTAMAQQVARYVGRERYKKLQQEIEALHTEVESELSIIKEEAEQALEMLAKAHNIILEDRREYDQAFTLVSSVKAMLARKRKLEHDSYSWGLLVFGYAAAWLLAFIVGFYYGGILQKDLTGEAAIVAGALSSALAGGIGGVIGILYSLYWHVSHKRDFDPQYIMTYLVNPIMGFVLGAIIYFVVATGFAVVNLPAEVKQDSTWATLFGVLLGWIAGFRQRFVFETIDKIVQLLTARPPSTDEKPSSSKTLDQDEGTTPERGKTGSTPS
jgi:hypothetical protein